MENENQDVRCAHCGGIFSIVSHRRHDFDPRDHEDSRRRRTRLLKCPLCHWKFEAPREADDGTKPDPLASPRPGRFNI